MGQKGSRLDKLSRGIDPEILRFSYLNYWAKEKHQKGHFPLYLSQLLRVITPCSSLFYGLDFRATTKRTCPLVTIPLLTKIYFGTGLSNYAFAKEQVGSTA